MEFRVNVKSNIIYDIENQLKKKNLPNIQVGDSIKIGVLIKEGNKERVQISEGVIISKNNSNLNTTITIRKVLQNIGVEKVYLIHSPRITEINITRKSKIRRAKLYYLRNRSGKATRLKQKFF
uniref:ribosomal protein L19 n=1 Tax=Hypnea pseudomusciformis TaxID=1545697 RepID=UPI0027DAA04C|nr:ribosomal protein L19 [Hypnea pseudomusciformis]YP_010903948.1 ribosomal protein L19 [Hypnea musciformis]WCH55206.1 ribosomal protein L19 [Hypnea pseudomusciformis]WCH56799.1 ribosomal protein L19 [Hypnea pseudomusciformis]WCH56999.1 ribosomal protein L19 [Hypnea musciformis]